MELKEFGKRLRNIRKSKDVSLDEIKEKTGISKSMIGYYESGKSNPTLTNIIKICKALNINISDLIDEEPTEQEKRDYLSYLTKKMGIDGLFMNTSKLSPDELMRLEEDLELSIRIIKEKYNV